MHCNEKFPIVFDSKKNYIHPKLNLIVQMGFTSCGKKVYYKITKLYETKGGDWIYDSDSINCDMVFYSIADKNQYNSLKI